MRYLVIARHGAYDERSNLSDRGRDQIIELTQRLKDQVLSEGQKIVILSSSAPRASQSAEVLVKELGICVDFEEYELLWSDNGHAEDIPGAIVLVEKRKKQTWLF